eukprot:m.57170 g.57170  ORF g.57170 m.57170 type:complete len:644 (-) comp12092_c2_seq1:120-2051(-)
MDKEPALGFVESANKAYPLFTLDEMAASVLDTASARESLAASELPAKSPASFSLKRGHEELSQDDASPSRVPTHSMVAPAPGAAGSGGGSEPPFVRRQRANSLCFGNFTSSNREPIARPLVSIVLGSPPPPEKASHIKRPMNAFMVWAQERRREVKMCNPTLHNATISRSLGEEWNALPEAEKQPFVERARALKAEHQQEHPDYKYNPRRKPKLDNAHTLSPLVTSSVCMPAAIKTLTPPRRRAASFSTPSAARCERGVVAGSNLAQTTSLCDAMLDLLGPTFANLTSANAHNMPGLVPSSHLHDHANRDGDTSVLPAFDPAVFPLDGFMPETRSALYVMDNTTTGTTNHHHHNAYCQHQHHQHQHNDHSDIHHNHGHDQHDRDLGNEHRHHGHDDYDCDSDCFNHNDGARHHSRHYSHNHHDDRDRDHHDDGDHHLDGNHRHYHRVSNHYNHHHGRHHDHHRDRDHDHHDNNDCHHVCCPNDHDSDGAHEHDHHCNHDHGCHYKCNFHNHHCQHHDHSNDHLGSHNCRHISGRNHHHRDEHDHPYCHHDHHSSNCHYDHRYYHHLDDGDNCDNQHNHNNPSRDHHDLDGDDHHDGCDHHDDHGDEHCCHYSNCNHRHEYDQHDHFHNGAGNNHLSCHHHKHP